MTRKILFFLLISFSSCSSMNRFLIEVQEPASVTIPVSAQNVLILNNTTTQPETFEIEITLDEKPIPEAYSSSLDSMVWSAIDKIADVLNESNFFNTIAIYRKPIRNDTEWLSLNNLSPEQQYDFYDNENIDALFVIEQLLFNLKEDIKIINSSPDYSKQNAFVVLRAYGIITCSMYTYGNEKPLITFQVSDSIFENSLVYNNSITLFKLTPYLILKELSRILGNKAAKRFIPTWNTKERILFVGYNSRMREAAVYATKSRWANAESIWITELGKKSKPTKKAKITYNLAVVNEVQDKLEQAMEWAQKSKEYLKNANKNNSSKEIKHTDNYIFELEQRIQNNHLLNIQWGKE